MQSRTRPSSTTSEASVVLIDHQVGLLTGVRDMTTQDLEHNVVDLARAGKVLGIPVVVTNAATDFWGPTIPASLDALGGQDILTRTIISSWDDLRFVERIEATRRKCLIFAGVSLPVCAALPAIAASYEFYLVVGASGSFACAGRDIKL